MMAFIQIFYLIILLIINDLRIKINYLYMMNIDLRQLIKIGFTNIVLGLIILRTNFR